MFLLPSVTLPVPVKIRVEQFPLSVATRRRTEIHKVEKGYCGLNPQLDGKAEKLCGWRTEWTWQPKAQEPGSGSLPAPTRFPISHVTTCRFLMDLQVERQRDL